MISNIITIIVFSLLITMSSCRKEVDGFDMFVVEAGDHECNGWRFHPYSRESLDFEFKVNDTWVWDDIVPAGVNGWSKIAGISESINHKKNRITLGVRYEVDKIIIGAYGNANGKLFSQKMCEVVVGGIYYCRISISNGFYVVNVNGYEWTHPTGRLHKVGVRLNPYIGGDYVLGHDWIVLIKFDKL